MKMKAAVIRQMGADQPYAESKPMRIEEVEIAAPQERELLIQIKAASLCHSDLSSVNGNRPRPMPMILGHEAAGVVVECGPGVTDIEVGDHVHGLLEADLLEADLLDYNPFGLSTSTQWVVLEDAAPYTLELSIPVLPLFPAVLLAVTLHLRSRE